MLGYSILLHMIYTKDSSTFYRGKIIHFVLLCTGLLNSQRKPMMINGGLLGICVLRKQMNLLYIKMIFTANYQWKLAFEGYL